MNAKWIMPSFLTSLISIIAISLNNKFLWHLDPDKLIASIGLTVNFVIVTLAGDIAKIKRGEKPNFNSTKLFTLLFACSVIGFSEYIGIDLDQESVWWIAGVAAAFITGKGIKDAVEVKKGETIVVNTPPTNTFESNK
jgi:hypothetical protein